METSASEYLQRWVDLIRRPSQFMGLLITSVVSTAAGSLEKSLRPLKDSLFFSLLKVLLCSRDVAPIFSLVFEAVPQR